MSRSIPKMACWRVVNERSGGYSSQGVTCLAPALTRFIADMRLAGSVRTDSCDLNSGRERAGSATNDAQGRCMTHVSSRPQRLHQ